jgi:hypothetical protein
MHYKGTRQFLKLLPLLQSQRFKPRVRAWPYLELDSGMQ